MKRYLTKGLEKYLQSNTEPWHMPGHKRKALFHSSEEVLCVRETLNSVMAMDVTEVPGTDDLHHPEDMIKKSLDELKRIYGTEGSFYLVNGSTCGIFSAVSACCKQKDKIIVADNCHKSVYNISQLMELEIVNLEAENINLGDIKGSVLPKTVERICEKNQDARAVVITSPTYEGILSDIKGIAKVVHKYGMYLIVDEAHGAHLPFVDELPKSAVSLKADIVVQSLHKTLPALTQTAVLHVNTEALLHKVKEYLSIYMSSSPSYVFMASMENAIAYAEEGEFTGYVAVVNKFREKVSCLKNISILNETSNINQDNKFFEIDPTRIVLFAKSCGEYISGNDFAKILSDMGNMVVEMSGINHVVLISTIVDAEKDFAKLFEVLVKIDNLLDNEESLCENTEIKINVEALVGKEARDNIYVYPPGSYIVKKGEAVSEEAAKLIVDYIKSGKRIYGRI